MIKNTSHSASPPSGRSARIRFIVVTVILAFCVAANMALIYIMSAEDPKSSGDRSEGITDAVADAVYPDIQQRPTEEQVDILTTLGRFIRKFAHFAEFASLGFFAALLTGHIARLLPNWKWWIQLTIPAVFGLLYAISDEIHQMFTNRTPAVVDVVIDFGGVLAGILLARFCLWLYRKWSLRAASRRERKESMA